MIGGMEGLIKEPSPGGGKASSQGWGCMMLFALPFAGAGIAALVQGLRMLPSGKHKEIMEPLLFGVIFTLGGLGMMVFGYYSMRAEKARNARKAAHPDEPWRWREDWAAGRADSQSGLGVWGIWIFAVFWNLVSGPVTVLVIPRELQKGNKVVLFALLFPLVGLGLLSAAIYATMQRRKYGRTVFKLLANPCVIGGQAAGMIEIPRKVKPQDGFKVELKCIRRLVTGSGKHRTTSETTLWEERATVTQDLLTHEQERTGVPVQFMIPASAEEASKEACNPSIHWRLKVEADVPGVDLNETFELPVFRTAESPAATGASSLAGPRWDRPVEDYQAPKNTRIQVMGLPTGGSAIVFPAARNLGVFFGVALFSGIFTAVIAVSVVKKAPIIFPIAFGLFDALLLMICVSMLTHSSRVEADANGVKVIDKGVLGKKESRYLADEVADVTTKVGMQAGSKNYYDLQLELKSGRTIALGSSIPDGEHAAWLAAVVKQAVGLKKSA